MKRCEELFHKKKKIYCIWKKSKKFVSLFKNVFIKNVCNFVKLLWRYGVKCIILIIYKNVSLSFQTDDTVESLFGVIPSRVLFDCINANISLPRWTTWVLVGYKIPRAPFRRIAIPHTRARYRDINRSMPSGFRVCITAASSRPNDLSRLSRVLTWMVYSVHRRGQICLAWRSPTKTQWSSMKRYLIVA